VSVPYALLFPGQGDQRVGMGADLAASCEGCRDAFEAADRSLGFPLSRLMAEGPEEQLTATHVAQPALVLLGVARARHLLAAEPTPPAALIGHSLGQYTALVVAGALDLDVALRLVEARGKLMIEAAPEGGAMASLVGLERAAVEAACERTRGSGPVVVACHNAPEQTVISGTEAAVHRVADACEDEGAVATMLRVATPFHSPLLSSMVEAFTARLEAAPIRAPELPVIDNVSARPLSSSASVRRALAAQIEAPVLFEQSVRCAWEMGIREFVQCGAGKSLSRFVKNTYEEATTYGFEDRIAAQSTVPRRSEHALRR
jgi:[acyl-carrier-protein] S-malonyltransferase